jgi:hypothetical protein
VVASINQGEKVMQKIRLDVQELRVESFDTANGAAKGKGTVRANQFSHDPWGGACDSRDCGSGDSCTYEWLACNCPVGSGEEC